MKVKTLEEALEFVGSVNMCTVFSGKVKGVPALWDVVDLPANGGGHTKWGARVEAVWTWKNELPETYPDDIFYGKIPGGHAVLMTIDYLVGTHYAKAHRAVEACSELAQQVYEIIRLNPNTSGELRKEAMSLNACSKSQFDTALKQLQVTLNIVRSNEPGLKNDTWVPFSEVYLDLVEKSD